MKISSLNPLAIVVALAAFVTVAVPAYAQNIGVINEERVLRESAVGIHIASRIQAISVEIDGELSGQRQPIEAESERLNAETAGMTQEAIAARPDLVQRIQTLNQQIQQFELARQQAMNELAATERAAMGPVLEALQEVLQAIVDERGYDILIDRSQVVYAGQAVDVSGDVITRLNTRLPTVPVNRVRAPQ